MTILEAHKIAKKILNNEIWISGRAAQAANALNRSLYDESDLKAFANILSEEMKK